MHLQTSLILAIASTALALPAVTQTNSTLEKRYNHGWIGNFANDECSGTPVGPRPESHLKDCVVFNPNVSPFVGIFFGTGWYSFDKLMFFSDTNCQEEMEVIFKSEFTTGSTPACINNRETETFDDGVFGSLRTI